MEKLLEILWRILNDKWIKYKFKFESVIAIILGREISIYSQNMVSYLKFLMRYPRLWYNQIYEPSCVFNESENRVYNEIYTDK